MVDETKTFGLRTVLSITTGRLLTKPQSDLYKLLGWMTNDLPFTHQLPRFINECKPWLLWWFPELTKANSLLPDLDKVLSRYSQSRPNFRAFVEGTVWGWCERVQEECGCNPEYDIPRIPQDDHERKHPYDELVVMRGTDKRIIVIGEGGSV